jgi:hypothetical protein
VAAHFDTYARADGSKLRARASRASNWLDGLTQECSLTHVPYRGAAPALNDDEADLEAAVLNQQTAERVVDCRHMQEFPSLGARESGTARLEEAVAAYRAALEEWTRARVPLDWAGTQMKHCAPGARGARERDGAAGRGGRRLAGGAGRMDARSRAVLARNRAAQSCKGSWRNRAAAELRKTPAMLNM